MKNDLKTLIKMCIFDPVSVNISAVFGPKFSFINSYNKLAPRHRQNSTF